MRLLQSCGCCSTRLLQHAQMLQSYLRLHHAQLLQVCGGRTKALLLSLLLEPPVSVQRALSSLARRRPLETAKRSALLQGELAQSASLVDLTHTLAKPDHDRRSSHD